MGNPDTVLEECGGACRNEMSCSLDDAVNEQTLLCRGYYLDFTMGSRYFMGVFENPWYGPEVF